MVFTSINLAQTFQKTDPASILIGTVPGEKRFAQQKAADFQSPGFSTRNEHLGFQ